MIFAFWFCADDEIYAPEYIMESGPRGDPPARAGGLLGALTIDPSVDAGSIEFITQDARPTSVMR
jgi:hypothetical protein